MNVETSMGNALVAANHAADIVVGRLQADVASLYEQIDELEAMSKKNPMSEHDRMLMGKLKRKVMALDPGCSDTLGSI